MYEVLPQKLVQSLDCENQNQKHMYNEIINQQDNEKFSPLWILFTAKSGGDTIA